MKYEKRVIESIIQLLSNKEIKKQILHQWKIKPIFCIGEETSNLLVSKLDFDNSLINGFQSINSLQLSDIIIKWYKQEKQGNLSFPFLFLCGNIRRNELPNELKKNSIPFEELIVYETNLESNYLHDILNPSIIPKVVYKINFFIFIEK